MHYLFCIFIGAIAASSFGCIVSILYYGEGWSLIGFATPIVLSMYFPMYLWTCLGRMRPDAFRFWSRALFVLSALSIPFAWLLMSAPEEAHALTFIVIVVYLVVYIVFCFRTASIMSHRAGESVSMTLRAPGVFRIDGLSWLRPVGKFDRHEQIYRASKARQAMIASWPFTVVFFYRELVEDCVTKQI